MIIKNFSFDFKSKFKVKRIYISSRNRSIAKKLTRKYRKITVLNNNQEIIDKKKINKKILKKKDKIEIVHFIGGG